MHPAVLHLLSVLAPFFVSTKSMKANKVYFQLAIPSCIYSPFSHFSGSPVVCVCECVCVREGGRKRGPSLHTTSCGTCTRSGSELKTLRDAGVRGAGVPRRPVALIPISHLLPLIPDARTCAQAHRHGDETHVHRCKHSGTYCT